MSKAIFIDVDGTLVDREGNISLKVKDALKQLKENGHYVFVCTGRNRRGIDDLIEYFDGAICSAGGYIEYHNKVIFQKFMSKEDIKEAREIFDQNHILYNLESTEMTFQADGLDKLFVAGNIDEENMNSEKRRLIAEHNERFNAHSLQEYEQNPTGIYKMCFIAYHQEDLTEPQKLLSYKYNFIIHEMFSTDVINGEIIKKDTTKATAIEHIINELGVSQEDTICFGDSMNDYEMIKFCHHGVVMANGSQELKQYADSICESVDDDGIYHELKRLNLCK